MDRRLLLKRTLASAALVALLAGSGATSSTSAAAGGSIKIVSPKDGEKITSTDIPVEVQVSNFKLAGDHVGLPDADGEGHIHVMIDGMNMGVLFNFHTTPKFTLPGDAIKPGKHELLFTLATNTHMDHEDSLQKVTIDYQPTTPKPAPAPANATGAPTVKIIEPADGATVGPTFNVKVDKSNFTASEGLEGKPNLKGYGHYHVFVDMDMTSMDMSSAMMSMAGMVLMPGKDTFSLDLSAWKNGKHTLTVEPVQNDHTPIQGVKEAMITINLQGASGSGPGQAAAAGSGQGAAGPAPGTLPKTGGLPADTVLPLGLGAAVLALVGGLGLRRRRVSRG